MAADTGPAPRAAAPADGALFWLLVAFLAAQPSSTDIYLPALPTLGESFAAPPAAVQLTLSVFIAGFALAQLVIGPLTDRFGRRPVVLAGGTLLVASLIGGALAPSLNALVAARFVQALGVCCLVVCARAIVRDRHAPAVGAQVMARALAWMGLAPLLGPPLAGLALPWIGWRGLFLALALLAACLLIASWRHLEETNLRRNARALAPRQLLGNYAAIATTGEFWAYGLTGAASYCALFGFISGSPYLVIDVLGYPPWAFGFVFSAVTAAFITGSMLLARWLPRHGARRVLIGAASFSCLCGLTMGGLALAGVERLAALLLPMIGITVAHGLVNATAQVAALGPFAARAGSAAALNGFQMHGWGALVGLWIGLSFDGTLLPFSLTIAVITCLLALSAHTLVRHYAGPARPRPSAAVDDHAA